MAWYAVLATAIALIAAAVVIAVVAFIALRPGDSIGVVATDARLTKAEARRLGGHRRAVG